MTGPVPAGAPTIDQKDVAFVPNELSVSLGATVYFTDSEAIFHSVDVNGANLLGRGGLMKQGEVIAWKPSAAGDYLITCDIHSAMRAVVRVR